MNLWAPADSGKVERERRRRSRVRAQKRRLIIVRSTLTVFSAFAMGFSLWSLKRMKALSAVRASEPGMLKTDLANLDELSTDWDERSHHLQVHNATSLRREGGAVAVEVKDEDVTVEELSPASKEANAQDVGAAATSSIQDSSNIPKEDDLAGETQADATAPVSEASDKRKASVDGDTPKSESADVATSYMNADSPDMSMSKATEQSNRSSRSTRRRARKALKDLDKSHRERKDQADIAEDVKAEGNDSSDSEDADEELEPPDDLPDSIDDEEGGRAPIIQLARKGGGDDAEGDADKED